VDLHRGHRLAIAMSPPAAPAAWRVVASMFTIIPVAAPAQVGRDSAARAVLLLPVLGGLLGVAAAGVLVTAEAVSRSPEHRLLAAVLAIAALAALTGGLHLDGLADTADGLGSGRAGPHALAIMRRSDVGPMGAAALLFVVLAQATALAALTPGWQASLALVAAVATSRVAVLMATAEQAARPDGFGALIAGTTRPATRATAIAALFGVVIVAATAAVGLGFAARCAGAVLAGLAVAAAIQRIARRRLGGITGDVFGAVIEVCTAAVLVVFALSG
jgi:adenosylcobinamide-GDP ribazoletransferase